MFKNIYLSAYLIFVFLFSYDLHIVSHMKIGRLGFIFSFFFQFFRIFHYYTNGNDILNAKTHFTFVCRLEWFSSEINFLFRTYVCRCVYFGYIHSNVLFHFSSFLVCQNKNHDSVLEITAYLIEKKNKNK